MEMLYTQVKWLRLKLLYVFLYLACFFGICCFFLVLGSDRVVSGFKKKKSKTEVK